MAIFNSYVKLPEGKRNLTGHGRPWAHGWLGQPPCGVAHRHPPVRNPGWTPPDMVPELGPGVLF